MGMTITNLLKQKHWNRERKALRKILLDCGLEEAVKWSKLTYTHAGGNVAIIYGFADSCAVGFFKGALLEDPDDLLVAPGKHSQAMRRLHFGDLEEVNQREDTLRGFVEQALALEETGEVIDFDEREEIEPPEELVDAFDEDAEFRQAFDALTPGRQRGYLIHFSQPKQSKTRMSRIEKSVPFILEGIGFHDQYKSKKK